MKAVEFYEKIDADYDEVLERMLNKEEIVCKFLKKYLEDSTFFQLEEKVQIGQTEEIFKAAHSLNGVAANLGFKPLVVPVRKLVEITRKGQNSGVNEIFQDIKDVHLDIIKLIETVE